MKDDLKRHVPPNWRRIGPVVEDVLKELAARHGRIAGHRFRAPTTHFNLKEKHIMTENIASEFDTTPSIKEREKMSSALYRALYHAVNKHAQGMPTFDVDRIVNTFAAEITEDNRAMVKEALANPTHEHEGYIQ